MAEKYVDDFLTKYLKTYTDTDKSFVRHVLHDIINFINKQDLQSQKMTVLTFPPFDSHPRYIIHRLAIDLGLKTLCIGEGRKRIIMVGKHDSIPTVQIEEPRKPAVQNQKPIIRRDIGYVPRRDVQPYIPDTTVRSVPPNVPCTSNIPRLPFYNQPGYSPEQPFLYYNNSNNSNPNNNQCPYTYPRIQGDRIGLVKVDPKTLKCSPLSNTDLNSLWMTEGELFCPIYDSQYVEHDDQQSFSNIFQQKVFYVWNQHENVNFDRVKYVVPIISKAYGRQLLCGCFTTYNYCRIHNILDLNPNFPPTK